MPSLDDLSRAFAAVTTFQLLLGLLVCVAIVMLFSDWRLSLLALATQYILVAVLLSTLIPLQIAAVRMIAGGLVATMFFITAHSADPRRRRQQRPEGGAAREPTAILRRRDPRRLLDEFTIPHYCACPCRAECHCP